MVAVRSEVGQLAVNALAQELYRRCITLDPYHEGAHRGLMRVLAAGGQRGDALTHYARYRQWLQSDLGVDPEAATVELADQIRQSLPPAQLAARRQVGSRRCLGIAVPSAAEIEPVTGAAASQGGNIGAVFRRGAGCGHLRPICRLLYPCMVDPLGRDQVAKRTRRVEDARQWRELARSRLVVHRGTLLR
ncbi:MAG: bacterial transcriptional activator domain-containing protein [Caldilineaceae bacterium]